MAGNNKEEKTGIMSDAEQDRAIMELVSELKVTNLELNHTNESIKTLVGSIGDICGDVEAIKKEDIPRIEKELAQHGVWVKLISLFAGSAIGVLAAKIFGGSGGK